MSPKANTQSHHVELEVDYQPHPKQMEIRRSDARFKVVAAGRRGGKTEYAGATCLFGDGHKFKGAVLGHKVWWVAPDYGRASVGWNLAKRLTQSIPKGLIKTSEEQKKMEFPGGGFLQIKSGFDPDTLRGEGLDYVVLDEAAFMKKKEVWTEALRPALADRKGGAMFISTPQGFNFFHELYEKGVRGDKEGKGEWRSFHFTSYDNPHVEDEEIEAARLDMPDHVFRQEFLAEFLEGGGLPVFPREWWEGKNRYDQTQVNENLLVGTWIAADTANRDKEDSAYSAFVVGSFTPRYELLIREVVRGKWEFNELPYVAANLASRYRGRGVNQLRHFWIEDAASGIQLIHTLRSSAPPFIAERITPAKPIPKEISWQAASVWARRGFVKHPYPDEANAAWLMDFEQEIYNVPGSKNFDMADAYSILIRHLSPLFSAAYRRRGEVAA